MEMCIRDKFPARDNFMAMVDTISRNHSSRIPLNMRENLLMENNMERANSSNIIIMAPLFLIRIDLMLINLSSMMDSGNME